MKQKSLLIVAGMLASCLVGNCSFTSGEDFAHMVKHIPAAANALVLVDANELFNSKIAQREGWGANREQQFAAGLTSIPPKASKVLLSANIDVEVMHPTWEAAVVEMEARTLIAGLASRLGGVIDKVSTLQAVRLPDNSFLVQFSDGLYGAMAPANRQQVSRWISVPSPMHSSYLKQAVGYADSTAQVIMVLDLEDAFAAHELDLGKLEAVRNSKIDRAKLDELISSVRGVMLGISFSEQTHARLKIDFGQDAALISDIAKPLVLDIIGSYGVMIEEFSDWDAVVKGQGVSLGGPLGYHGLTRLASLTRLPTSALHTAAVITPDNAASTGTAEPAEKPTPLETTQKYYTSVKHLLENLRAKKHDMKTMGQVAQWFENYGRHVDQLPTLGVDKEMLEYGAYISQQLHGASMGLKGTTIQRNVDANAAANSSRIYGGALGNITQSFQGGYGYGAVGGNYGRRRATNAAFGIAGNLGVVGAYKSGLRQQQQARTAVNIQARASAASGVQQIVQNIETASTQIRQSMTEKYQVQF